MNSEKLQTNIESWKKSLLDITSRNQAINFRRRKSSTLQIISPSMDEFLERMVSSRGLSFAEIFDDEEEDEEDEGIATLLDDDDDDFITVYGIRLQKKDIYSKDELLPAIENFQIKRKGNFLFSSCNNKTQRKILRNLMKKARTFKEENAINVLYFAVGYLEWYESKDSDICHKAPLLFMSTELSQETFDAPFKVSIPEGDLLLNDSLLRKFNQDFRLDISFDTDQMELSILEIYEKYKAFIYSRIADKRWKIYDEIDLGIFSFSKINMVKDLEENVQKISDNALIQQLIGEYQPIELDSIYDEEEIDKIIDPGNYYHILDADSSQEIAIQSAIAGKSFVLQGPPGTGKSQTITNIITELIGRNKKVLFVAEKKAALDVVYNNLKKIGLNDYALPIHNSKLDKKEVLRELANTLEKGQERIEVDGHFSSQQILRYNDSKSQLIDYPKILLQKRYPINKSLYQLYGILLKYQKYEEIQFNIRNISKISEQELIDLDSLIYSFYHANRNVGFEPKQHAWYGIKRDFLTISEKETLLELVKSLQSELNNIENILAQMDLFKIDKACYMSNVDNYRNLLKHMLELRFINTQIYHHDSILEDIKIYELLMTQDQNINALKKSIEDVTELKIIDLDTDKYKRIVKTNDSFIKRLFSSDYRKVRKETLYYYKNKKIKYEQLKSLLNDVDNYKGLVISYSENLKKLEYHTNEMGLLDLTNNLYDLKWYDTFTTTRSMCHMTDDNDELSILLKFNKNKNNYESYIHNFSSTYDITKKIFDELYSHFELSNNHPYEMSSDELNKYITKLITNAHQIETILGFNFALNKCKERDLSDFCDKVVDLNLKSNYQEIFYKRFYTLLVDDFLHDLLPGFSGSTLDIARSSFKSAELTIQKMAKSVIDRNIINGIPNYNGLEGYNIEVATLRAEANKSRKILPFRVLFSKIPNLITQLKPCLMMSPLSVSTFLRGTNMTFDTVIFDEASQVKPENAIGAIFRAKQFIVTGDKEQLPPTNFFQNVDDDENTIEENYDTTAFDSILEVSSGFINSIKLRWHYRSKFEELIRPSNKEIYRDLITFPSISKPDLYEGIKFSYVDGIYVERKNEIEADKVIESLAHIIEKYGITKTVGVVTFNTEQQLLVERKINHFRRTNPQYEEFFTNNESEPFFVKNIETVQGDERDIIIMSIGYGPDGKGKVSMNFGPLNQTNGYRRLNVAVTRAKTCLVLVTSIKGTDIDLNRTQSRGAIFLKHYLEYAEYGEDDKVDTLDELAGFDSPFEEDVYDELINLGYGVKKQVGCSGYRIDLAIINPSNPSSYLLGVECDGATYHSSKSVRDRDRLRQQVLEDRNWTIYRVWSTDWIKNKKTQIEKLDKFIKSIDLSVKRIAIENPTIIPVSSVKKEKSVIKFEQYPNYESLTSKYGSRYYDSQISGFVLEIISKTSPIHENELKKIVPYFWGRQKYTSVVDACTRPILRSLSSRGEISLKGEYIIHKSTPISFRETKGTSTRRDFSNIYPEELKNGILKILEVTKTMNLDELYTMIVNLCGFQSVSSKIKETVFEAIASLKRTKKVKIVDNNLIELIENHE